MASIVPPIAKPGGISPRDRGVSPVIAVILMVAITVILAAVIGSFVLDIGDKLNEGPPQAQFSAEQSEVTLQGRNGATKTYTAVNITHMGGDPIDTTDITVTAGGDPAFGWAAIGEQDPYADDYSMDKTGHLQWVGPGDRYDTLTAGDTMRVVVATTLLEEVDGELGVHDFRVWDPHNTFSFHSGKFDPQPPGWHSHPENPDSNAEIEASRLDEELKPDETIRISYESTDGTAQILYEYEVT